MRSLMIVLSLLATAVNASVITVQDDSGKTISLQQPAKRVIALAPHVVEVVYAVGGGDQLVGAVSYSDYPEAAKQVPRVGSYQNFSHESILRLQPDLIIGWASGNGDARLQKIEELGLTVYRGEPKTLAGVAKSMRDIGLLLGNKDQGRAAQNYEATLKNLAATYRGKKPVSVFYQVWNQPLQTLNGEQLISKVIELCGGSNVFANEPVIAPKISVESVLRADPQTIIASGMDIERPEWLDEWLAWPQLQAVKNQQLYFIPPDIIQRHTPRVLEGAAIMCEQLDRARQVYYP